jgi:poly-beta-1,6-N-acetyl-D-glucosamine synthase
MTTTSGVLFFDIVNILVFTYAVAIAFSYLFLAALSTWEMRKYKQKNGFVDYNYILSSPFAPVQ